MNPNDYRRLNRKLNFEIAAKLAAIVIYLASVLTIGYAAIKWLV